MEVERAQAEATSRKMHSLVVLFFIIRVSLSLLIYFCLFQINQLKKENVQLKTDCYDLKFKLDSIQKSQSESQERGQITSKELSSLQESLRTLEAEKNDWQNERDSLLKQKENKHSQLIETVRMNHRLEKSILLLN
jgi:chromosome segregation ATPase